jgi:hypothetical protein
MRIGLDFHGVINKNPEFFSDLTHNFTVATICIVSGLPKKILKQKLSELKIYYDELYSITDDLLEKNVSFSIDKRTGRPIFPDEEWNSAKAKFCKEQKIDLMIDDNEEYLKCFTTPCILWKRII